MVNPFDYISFKFRFRFYSRRMIESYQRRNARRIVNYAVKNSPFLRKRYQGRAEFGEFPTTNKKLMMENLSTYNTLGLKRQDLIDFALSVEKSRDFSKRFNGINIGMSSGTSGNKGIIITTRREEEFLKAMYLSRLVIPQGEKLNCAFILRVFSPAFSFNRFGHKITYVNQLRPIDKICMDIEKINPNVISAPPSMLKILGRELLELRLHIKPRLIYSYAETLYPAVKRFLENAYGCPVHEVYQGSEGCYAITCREGRLHINEDIVLFEPLNKDGTTTKAGQPCHRLLVTDLHKKSQPIIRYELNDIITISKNGCGCGSSFRVIESIQGRADDLLWAKKGQKVHHIFQDYVVRAIISCSDMIDDFQVVQSELGRLKVFLHLADWEKDEALKDRVIGVIKDIFVKYECSVPRIVVEFKRPEPNPNSKKLSRVICTLKDDGFSGSGGAP
jgi:putative adenylate-forming enzyme